jgi:hypothetical protein
MPEVKIADDEDQAQEIRESGSIALARSNIPSLAENVPSSVRKDHDAKAEALASVLAAYDLFDGRSYDEQHQLLQAILHIFFSESRS